MRPNPFPGKFIVFEGIDFCGKGTQLNRLEKYLKAYTNLRVLLTQEPTDEYYGKCIRKILASEDLFDDVSSSSLQTLYAVDSREHLKNKVIPALKKGKIVISDRYRLSSLAYGAENTNQVEQYFILNELILGNEFIWPDLIILVDITSKEAMARKEKAERKVIEAFEKEEKLKKVRDNYLYMAHVRFPNFQIVSGTGDEIDIFVKIREAVGNLLNIIEA